MSNCKNGVKPLADPTLLNLQNSNKAHCFRINNFPIKIQIKFTPPTHFCFMLFDTDVSEVVSADGIPVRQSVEIKMIISQLSSGCVHFKTNWQYFYCIKTIKKESERGENVGIFSIWETTPLMKMRERREYLCEKPQICFLWEVCWRGSSLLLAIAILTHKDDLTFSGDNRQCLQGSWPSRRGHSPTKWHGFDAKQYFYWSYKALTSAARKGSHKLCSSQIFTRTVLLFKLEF